MERRRRERSGHTAEALAAWLLRAKGFRILARRYATPVGEIDLVARRADLLIFVEVKRRPGLDAAAEALGRRQQLRIARAAEIFLQRHPAVRECGIRFDAIALAPWRWPVHLVDVWRG